MAAVGKSILLVEDEAIIAIAEAKKLREVGYSVTHVGTGERAIAEVEARDGKIGLILMDIDLGGGIDGTQAAREILRGCDIPILFLSSHIERDIVARTEGITNYGYVVKSSSFTVLDASIKMAFRLFEAQQRINQASMDMEVANEELHVALDELHRSNDELALSEEKFSKAFYTNPDSIIITRLSDGLCLDINEGFTRMTGFTREEAIGRSARAGDLNIIFRQETLDQMNRRLREKGCFSNLVGEYRRKDGSIGKAEMSANLIKIEGETCILSVTRELSECAPGEDREFFRFLSEDLPAYVCSFLPDGTLLHVNGALAALVSSKPEELVGRVFFDMIDPREARLLRPRLAALTPASPVEVHDQSYPGPDGSFRYQEWRNRAFFDGEGRLAKIYAIGFDVTERKRTEGTIRSLLEEKEVLLREVHHRVKNNMSTIRSLLSLEEGLQREESAKEALRDASARVNSMAVLYDKLYSSENYRELRADCYLSSLIDEIVAIFPNKGSVRVDARLEALILDAKLMYPLGIIVNELITNSMKYAFDGHAEGLISIRLHGEGSRACLEYEDNGIGLPLEAETRGSRGFGMQLVGLLASQIGAAVEIERGPRAKYRLEFDRRA